MYATMLRRPVSGRVFRPTAPHSLAFSGFAPAQSFPVFGLNPFCGHFDQVGCVVFIISLAPALWVFLPGIYVFSFCIWVYIPIPRQSTLAAVRAAGISSGSHESFSVFLPLFLAILRFTLARCLCFFLPTIIPHQDDRPLHETPSSAESFLFLRPNTPSLLLQYYCPVALS